MALFTDGGISDLEDLRAYDTSILGVSSAEEVDLAAKLEVATTEIGVELQEFLAKRTGAMGSPLAAPRLEQVVVTPALKHWHVLRALTLIYGDVAGNHMDSRYESKWKDYRTRARWASDTVHRIGIGIAAAPLARASQPIVRTEPGATPVATYHIQIAWRGPTGCNGATSEVLTYTTDQDGLPAVRAEGAPKNAVAYDVYIGSEADSISKQNLAPIALGSEWALPASGLISGEAVPEGQSPDWFVRNDRVFLRG